MTNEEKIQVLQELLDYLCCKPGCEAPEYLKMREAMNGAIASLRNPQADVPLTLEQLQERGRSPALVKVLGPTSIHRDGWCEIEVDPEDDDFATIYWPGSEVVDIGLTKDYGNTWIAYAYPPAHIDREAWEPCEWCGEWLGGDCRPREQDAGYKLYAGYCKQVAADDFYENETEELNYCPICGRPFTQKAWAELEKRLRG